MTPEQFGFLSLWIKAEAKAAMARRTYKNDRAIAEVEEKAARAEAMAREVMTR